CDSPQALAKLKSEREHARDLEKRGDREEALVIYRSLAGQFTNVSDLQLDVARVADLLRRPDDVIAAYRQFVVLEPSEPRGHELLGWALLERGRGEEALRSFRESVRRNAAKAPVWGAM